MRRYFSGIPRKGLKKIKLSIKIRIGCRLTGRPGYRLYFRRKKTMTFFALRTWKLEEDGDAPFIAKALGTLARARGMSQNRKS